MNETQRAWVLRYHYACDCGWIQRRSDFVREPEKCPECGAKPGEGPGPVIRANPKVLEDADVAIRSDRKAREFAWAQYKRGVQDTVDALRAGIAGMSERSVSKVDILKFCEFTEQRQHEPLPPDFPSTLQ